MANPERTQKQGLKANYDTKWTELERQGFKRPRNSEENAQRLRDARDFDKVAR